MRCIRKFTKPYFRSLIDTTLVFVWTCSNASWATDLYPRWDSNPHWIDLKSIAIFQLGYGGISIAVTLIYAVTRPAYLCEQPLQFLVRVMLLSTRQAVVPALTLHPRQTRLLSLSQSMGNLTIELLTRFELIPKLYKSLMLKTVKHHRSIFCGNTTNRTLTVSLTWESSSSKFFI